MSTHDKIRNDGHISNFLRNIIDADLSSARLANRQWAGSPGDATHHQRGEPDTARLRTRFPPEPNGYLHIGHAKSICLNFGLARDYGGRCHMRFDDTNPEKEEQEYVDSILDAVRWLGFNWQDEQESNLYYASDYFGMMAECAEYLIQTGHAYVDAQNAEEMRASRGTLTEPGKNSPWRERSIEDNLRLFQEMRAGQHPEGSLILRAKIDMSAPNINLRDPAIYRIRFAHHHRTQDAWCVYPMYTFAHPIEDALENITHSICTLEFEDQRPFYDWLLERLAPKLRAPQFQKLLAYLQQLSVQGLEAQKEFALHCCNIVTVTPVKLGHTAPERQVRQWFEAWRHDSDKVLKDLPAFYHCLLQQPETFAPMLRHALEQTLPNALQLPHQYEFARLNLSYVVTSKRKLAQLVHEQHVNGWDDPRMPTLVGLRRRGYTPESLQLFAERIGVSKSDSWIDYSVLEQALRDDQDEKAARSVAVLEPLKLVLTNVASDWEEMCSAPVHPHFPERGRREFPMTRELWVEREDFAEVPPKGYFRLFPGNKVRLKYGYVVECTGCIKDVQGQVIEVQAQLISDTKSGTPGADSVKVKGNITWVSAVHAQRAEVRLYDRLFTEPQPDAGGKNFLEALNPNSKKVVKALIEPGTRPAAGQIVQFERFGYFVADRLDSTPEALVFNRIVTLKDSWGKT
ncbi:MAG: glutamine--tRNA ligase [Burkholderiales bacterium]|jgi:glutaminyl-tRNA synthetase|nr:glutamine--tRNA ligase [Burkholderiales bacterium]MCA3154386.1 glutamine--tRNA ligase [Burkholderiales bacterium]MCA3157378.1 glutamine--tRNA ligase [Burkholderiales bacterium]MCE2984399.1 glutamine--tRNA ligase [Burkholderiales bacterium]